VADLTPPRLETPWASNPSAGWQAWSRSLTPVSAKRGNLPETGEFFQARRHMSKSQQALANALIYPGSEKAGRKKKGAQNGSERNGPESRPF
jgi:hypothetical protein